MDANKELNDFLMGVSFSDDEEDKTNLMLDDNIGKTLLDNNATIEYINGHMYYKKIPLHSGNSSIDLWNELYGDSGKLLQLDLDAFKGRDNYDYFPSLGENITIPKQDQTDACIMAQNKLINIGYYHNDLYDEKRHHCNITNLVSIDGEYYPIDMDKIYRLNSKKGGNINTIRKKYTKRKYRQNKKRHFQRKTKNKLYTKGKRYIKKQN
jgi:hypothetical protein